MSLPKPFSGEIDGPSPSEFVVSRRWRRCQMSVPRLCDVAEGPEIVAVIAPALGCGRRKWSNPPAYESFLLRVTDQRFQHQPLHAQPPPARRLAFRGFARLGFRKTDV